MYRLFSSFVFFFFFGYAGVDFSGIHFCGDLYQAFTAVPILMFCKQKSINKIPRFLFGLANLGVSKQCSGP